MALNVSTLGNPQRRIHEVTRAFKKIISLRSVLAFVLMFWCAGTGCMMVSYARAAVANDSSMTDMEASSSMEAHACCMARHRALKANHHGLAATANPDFDGRELLTTPSTPPQTGVMNCCLLTSGSIVVNSRSQSHDDASVVQRADASSQILVESNPRPLAIPLRLPNRVHSYLLDCAFLI